MSLEEQLENLERVLVRYGEARSAQLVRRARDGSDEDRRAFLVSNELWGGSGSIADQAGVRQGREVRRVIETALEELGVQQIERGLTNVRTEMWVKTFLSWR